MSYTAVGASEGYTPPWECSDYVIRSDGRCADTSGVYQAAWYEIETGACVEPPPINCEVYAENLPPSCPAGYVLHSAVPSGCSPAPGGGTSQPPSGPPAPVGPLPPPQPTAIVPDPASPPKPKKAGFVTQVDDAIRNYPIATAAVAGGLLLIIAGAVSR